MHVYKIENLKSYSEGRVTWVLKFWHVWGTFYLTISFAGAIGYFHSIAGCDMKPFDKRILLSPIKDEG